MAEIHQENNTNTGTGAGAVLHGQVIQWIQCNGDFVNSGNIVNGDLVTSGEVEVLRSENARLKDEVKWLRGIIENLTGNSEAL
jgi:hypothetical protein